MNVSKVKNGGSEIHGPVIFRQAAGTFPVSSPAKEGRNGTRPANPVDTVFLSEQASRALSVDLSAKAFTTGATASPEVAAAVKDMDTIIPAMQRHGEEAGRYMEKLSALARDTFGLGDNVSIMTSGAGNAMLDNLAKENGLEKPEIPEILKKAA